MNDGPCGRGFRAEAPRARGRRRSAYRGAVDIRTATEDDVDAIVALVGWAYRGTGGSPGWTSEAHLFVGPRTDPEHIRATLGATEHTLIVAERDGEVVGCCTVTDRGDSAYFGLFAVSPRTQGAGVGSALLA